MEQNQIIDGNWQDGPLLSIGLQVAGRNVRFLVDSACQMFGVIRRTVAEELGLSIRSYHGQSAIVGWDGKAIEKGILGKVVAQVAVGGKSRWYGLWVTEEAAEHDGILGSGWLEYEDVALEVGRKKLWMRRKGDNTPVDCHEPSHTKGRLCGKGSWADVRATEEKLRKVSMEEIEKRLPKHLQPFAKAFLPTEDELAGEVPDHSIHDTKIELTTDDLSKLPRERLRPLSEPELAGLRTILDDLLAKGFIRHSSSPYSSAVRLVRRGDKPGYRLTVDYRKLNDHVKKDRYQVPLIPETLRSIRHAKKVSKIDISSAFHRIRLREGDEQYTAFVTRYGLFEWTVTPFGLSNAPACFQRALNRTLEGLLDNGVSAYADDILIYAETDEELQRLEIEVLRRLMKANLPADIRKCEFGVEMTKFLGMILHAGRGAEMDPAKVKAVREWERPKTVREVRSFIGMVNHLRTFLPHLAEHTRPLHSLISRMNKPRSNEKVEWDKAAEQAFATLKNLVTKQQGEGGILRAWEFGKEGRLETDASTWAAGGQLLQKDDNNDWRPVGFCSCQFSGAECNYTTHDKEMLAIIKALRMWEAELLSCEDFEVVTDHRALEQFTTVDKRSERHLRWKDRLAEFPGLRWRYRPGKENVVADALSRKLEDMPKVGDRRLSDRVTSVISPDRLPKEAIAQDQPPKRVAALRGPDRQQLWGQAREQDLDHMRWTLDVDEGKRQWSDPKPPRVEIADCEVIDGVLKRRGRIWAPVDERLRTELLSQFHDPKEAGHPGREAMYASIGREYFWPGLQDDVRRYVRNCDICGRNRQWREKMGLLQPLPIPEQPWLHIAMDYAVQMPEQTPERQKSRTSLQGRNILIIVDRLTKEVELQVTNTLEAQELAAIFIRNIVARHGWPESIVSDRGSQFTSSFWAEICRQAGTERHLSTAYHPQSDGQSERTVQEVKSYLRKTIQSPEGKGMDWQDLIPYCQLALNNRPHSTLGISPFELTHGRPANMGFDGDRSSEQQVRGPGKDGRQLAARLQQARRHAQASIASQQEAQESQANKRRKAAPQYEPGDVVWLSLRNREEGQGVMMPRNGKYKVQEKIGARAYRLDTPAGTHDVFHTELLRPASNDPFPSQRADDWQPGPVLQGDEEEDEWEVDDIIGERTFRRQKQVLVKWKGYETPRWERRADLEDTTALQRWEDSQNFSASAEGEGGLCEGGEAAEARGIAPRGHVRSRKRKKGK